MLYRFLGIVCVTFSLFAFGAKATDVEKRTFNGDPRRNITCLGSSYDLRLPIRPDGVDLNNLTMQQLCAKPVYGGASIGNALGGWCSKGLQPAVWWPSTDDDEDPLQGWDTNNAYQASTNGVAFEFMGESSYYGVAIWPQGQEYQLDRLYIGCLNRCFCSWGVEDLTVQPRREEPESTADVEMVPKWYHDQFVQIKIEVVDTVRREGEGMAPNPFGLDKPALHVVQRMGEPEDEDEEGFAEVSTDNEPERLFLSVDDGNNITCEGDMPSFILPEPYPNSNFSSPQQLCAIQWFGGLP